MNSKELRIISLLILDTIFFLIEAITGYAVHSLALVADSFHMLNDIISLFIALWAVKVKNTKPADGMYTYGWQRAEILGALINAVFLIALCFTIVIEAIQRLISPPEILNPVLVLVVGCLGLASNLVGLVLFHDHGHSHGHSHSHEEQEPQEPLHSHEDGHSHQHASEIAPLLRDRNQSSSDIREYMPENFIQRFDDQEHGKKQSMNMEGVFLHVLGDALGNIGVIAAALVIWKTNYSWKYYSDPLISLMLTVVILLSAWPLCKKSSKILLQATPTYLDSHKVINKITQLELVKSVHDFHVWNLNEDILIASLHLQLDNLGESPDFQKAKFVAIVKQVREVLHTFNIHSVTIQPEFEPSVLTSGSEFYGNDDPKCAVDVATGCFNGNCLKHDG